MQAPGFRFCRPTSKRPDGFSLVEVTLSATLLLMLVLGVGLLFEYGLWATRKAASRNEVLADVQWFTGRLERELRLAAAESLELRTDGNGLAYLSSEGAGGAAYYESTGRRIWQEYHVYWLGNREIQFRILPLNNSDAQRHTPTPLSVWRGPNLESACEDGRVRLRDVEKFQLRPATNAVEMILTCQKTGSGRGRPERAEMTTFLHFRNL